MLVPRRPIRALAVGLVLLAAGCSKPALVPDVLRPGQEAAIQIDALGDVNTWSVRTVTDDEVIVVRLTGEPITVSWLRIRVVLPGGAVAAELEPGSVGRYAIALSGRASQWTIELRLADQANVPVSYRMTVARPAAAPAAGARAACGDALGARGIDAWITSVARLPASGLPFPGLGTVSLSTTPSGGATSGTPAAGVPAIPHLRGGTVLAGSFAGLGCGPRRLHVTLWDTGKGEPPTLSIADAAGRPLCGGAGQAPCPINPSPGRWVMWTVAGASPIDRFSLKGDELFVSGVAIE